jgi:hypothetical protein
MGVADGSFQKKEFVMTTQNVCAHRSQVLPLLACLILTIGLTCSPGMAQHLNNPERPGATTVPTADDIPDRGAPTPKALLDSMAAVLSKPGPPQDWLSFQPPANRELAKEEVQLIVQLGSKAKETADVIEKKIGKMQANMVRSMQNGVTPGCELELRNSITEMSTDGKIDWDSVKITEAGDKARVSSSNTASRILLIKAGDKWYLGEGEGSGKETLAKDVDGTKKMNATELKMLDQLEQKVKSGEVNKKNFIQEYQNLVNESFNADSP